MKEFFLYFRWNFLADNKVYKPLNPYVKSNSNPSPNINAKPNPNKNPKPKTLTLMRFISLHPPYLMYAKILEA